MNEKPTLFKNMGEIPSRYKILMMATFAAISVNLFLNNSLTAHSKDVNWKMLSVRTISGTYETRRTTDNRQSWVGGVQINCNFPSLLLLEGRSGECGAKKIPHGKTVNVALIEVPAVFGGNVELVTSIWDENTIYIQRDIEKIREKCIDASKFAVWIWTALIALIGFVPFGLGNRVASRNI